MTAYRFCRTDDMGRLVEAHNRCWLPHHPGEPPLTLPEFKGLVRERQLWCSSCLVAYEGQDPIGYLFGCKRERETLLHRFAVHPDHLRHGHGRHLLTSISSKLAILGPPRLVVEAPEEAAAALGLLRACGYAQEETLTDWVREADLAPPTAQERPGDIFIPVSAAELQANRLLEDGSPLPPSSAAVPPPWERTAATFLSMGDRLSGSALVREERIVAAILYIGPVAGPPWEAPPEGRILRLQAALPGDDGGELLDRLVARQVAAHPGRWILPRGLPNEAGIATLKRLGFEPGGRFLRMAATARPA
jgi:ribosomal protein S18 acetylase RimI-like enzyme